MSSSSECLRGRSFGIFFPSLVLLFYAEWRHWVSHPRIPCSSCTTRLFVWKQHLVPLFPPIFFSTSISSSSSHYCYPAPPSVASLWDYARYKWVMMNESSCLVTGIHAQAVPLTQFQKLREPSEVSGGEVSGSSGIHPWLLPGNVSLSLVIAV